MNDTETRLGALSHGGGVEIPENIGMVEGRNQKRMGTIACPQLTCSWSDHHHGPVPELAPCPPIVGQSPDGLGSMPEPLQPAR